MYDVKYVNLELYKSLNLHVYTYSITEIKNFFDLFKYIF